MTWYTQPDPPADAGPGDVWEQSDDYSTVIECDESPVEERLARLEYEVDVLRRTILFLSAVSAPATQWMTTKFEKGPPADD